MKVIQLHQEEKKLIALAVENNRQAQQRIYSQFSPKMLSVCRQYVKDVHRAEDVMITAFMKVFTNLSKFEHNGSFEGWIRRIMVNECIDFIRVKKNIFQHNEIDDLIASESEDADEILTFLNMDGMYANCLDKNNDRVHIAAWTEVELIK